MSTGIHTKLLLRRLDFLHAGRKGQHKGTGWCWVDGGSFNANMLQGQYLQLVFSSFNTKAKNDKLSFSNCAISKDLTKFWTLRNKMFLLLAFMNNTGLKHLGIGFISKTSLNKKVDSLRQNLRFCQNLSLKKLPRKRNSLAALCPHDIYCIYTAFHTICHDCYYKNPKLSMLLSIKHE